MSHVTRFSALLLASVLLPACGGGGGGGDGTQTRFTPSDSEIAASWHLKNTGQGGGTAGEDCRAEGAWQALRTGQGIRVCVIDDGVELTHEDLAPNVVAGASLNLNGGTDPAPAGAADNHGTAVAGVTCARGGNGTGGTGVAPFASLVGVAPIPAGNTQATTAMTHNVAVTDVYNMSYGPNDDGNVYSLSAAYDAAVVQGLTNGRGGKGTVYIRAAGNGGAAPVVDYANLDEENGHYGVIAVGAVGADGKMSDYQELGCCTLICGPTSSAGLPGILTTDRTGAAGYDPTNYTNTFGGTSSAAPLVSGVVALMLHANPSLTWRDVRRILTLTARKNDPTDAGWATNGAGRAINHKYGYGSVDATAAVQMAVGFNSLGTNLPLVTSPTDTPAAAIPDNDATGITRTITVTNSGRTRVDHVVVVADITHPAFRQLDITLTSPAGTVSRLAVPGVGGGASPGVNQLATVLLLNEAVDGTWTLRVKDLAAGSTGSLASWFLRIYAD